MPQSTVIPELAYPDVAEAVDWLCNAFGFTLRLRIANHRAQMNIGTGAMVITELKPGTKIARTHSIMVRVKDVDAHYQRTVMSGALCSGSPVTYPYGERQYSVEDFAGHTWKFSQTVADVDPAEWGGTLA